jgi:SRSO17 transposase
VGGDSVYGDNPTFVQGVRALDKWYVLDISCDTLVWTEPPQVIAAADRPRPRRGRPPTTPLVVGERRRVDEIVAALPATAWRRLVVGEGSQGPRMYEYAEVTVWLCEDELPGPPERLLVRRSLGQSVEWKYHRAFAPATVPLEKLAQVRGTRWTIEEDIQCGKEDCGLDEYETRGWMGWHHHTALSLMALAFLVLQKQRLGEKRVADDGPRSPGAADAPIGGARVGRRRNPAVVGMAARTQPSGRGKPSQAAARRTAAAAK